MPRVEMNTSLFRESQGQRGQCKLPLKAICSQKEILLDFIQF
jgi:hypothetical protein